MWSIGCILCELLTGRLLFDTHADDEHLKMIERTVGAFPLALAQQNRTHFRHDGALRWDARSANKESRDRIKRCEPLAQVLRNARDADFGDLIARLLCIDASQRLTATAALQHRWLQV